MKKKPSVLITFQEPFGELIEEVMNALPTEFRRVHRHIHLSEKNTTDKESIRQLFDDSISSLREMGDDDIVTIAEEFTCDFLILIHEKISGQKLQYVTQVFKESFENTGRGQSSNNFDQLLFFVDAKSTHSYKKYNCYFIDSLDSNKNKISDDQLLKKIRYLFIYFLTSNIHESESIQEWGFNFRGTNPEVLGKTYKAIDIEYSGVPYIELNELFRYSVQKVLCRKILSIGETKEISQNDLKDLPRLEISQSVEETPNVPHPVNKICTKRKKADDFVSSSEIKSIKYEKEKLKKANQARKDLEDSVSKENSDITERVLNYICQNSSTIPEAQNKFNFLLKEGGVIDEEIGKLESEIFWPKSFRFKKFKAEPAHPKWQPIMIFFLIALLPWIVYEYILFVPFDRTLYVSLFGLISGLIYIVYSTYSVKKINSGLKENYQKNLESVDHFFNKAYRSFANYLELYLLKSIKVACKREWDRLFQMRIRWACYYLFYFYGTNNYKDNAKKIFDELRKDVSFKKNEGERKVIEEMKLQSKKLDDDLSDNLFSNDDDNMDSILGKVFENLFKTENNKLENLLSRIRKSDNGDQLLKIIDQVVSEYVGQDNLDLNSIDVEKLDNPEEYLDGYLNEKDDFIESIINKFKVPSPAQFESDLNNKAKLTDHYYLLVKESESKKSIDTKRFLFVSNKSEGNRNFKTEKFDQVFHTPMPASIGYIKIGTFNYSNGSK